MNTKLVLAILGVALVAAALVGVSAAQFVGAQKQTQTAYQTGPNCVNAATGEQVCANGTCANAYCNGTCTGTNCTGTCKNQTCNQAHAGCCSSTGTGIQNQNQYCNGYSYGCTEQNQNQNINRVGSGMMGQTGYGYGRCR